MTTHRLLKITNEDIMIEWNNANVDEEKLREGIGVIRQWMKKEDHLAEAEAHISDDVIERSLTQSKGSLENCKRQFDKILTTRALISDISLNRTFEEFDELMNNAIAHPLPDLNPYDRTRVYIIGITNENYQYTLLTIMKFLFMFADYRMNFDYSYSDRYIVDLKNIGANIITKFNPVMLKKIEVLSTKTYGVKMKGFHFINAPSYVGKLVYLLKKIFKDKLAERIYVHNSYDELHNVVAKDILPKDYGGNSLSCKDLVEQWRDYFKTEEAKHILDDGNKMFSNEAKRTDVQFDEEYLGLPGSFKNINVD